MEQVWDLIADPNRFPEWSSALEVTGVPTRIEKGSAYRQVTRGPLGMKAETTFEVEELDEGLHEIRLRCQTSGFYSHWLLTEVRGETFADVEMGVEAKTLRERAHSIAHTKGFLRRMADEGLDSLRRLVTRRS